MDAKAPIWAPVWHLFKDKVKVKDKAMDRDKDKVMDKDSG